ncbi:hypothetical protein BEWA_015950 [Theileria equi strain WA]|uniref:Signal peptide containing protein n=1 Tax=Theileria equi strain WA TaxID=1537102 RepID=L1LCM7_THEEQ|nr:hypothetical protein BEWA_015950 [Theileria equi strain WA]EKX73034.1 hypothetical protein BEWA_015950 [Theileria equi strain WA]|eukprot:XP_004832486.1 hypothetical protein BEWA_015950 [Theileria equi strain WA]
MARMRLFSLLYTILFIELARSKKKITFHLLEPNIFHTTLEVRQYSGVEIKKYTPRKGFRINKVKYGDKELWKSRWLYRDGCKSIQFHSKGETKLISLWIVNNKNTLDIKRFHKVGTDWNAIGLEDFNNKIREAKAQPTQEQPAAKHIPDYESKVDMKLFDVKESNIDGPFYLTCTPKENKNPTKLVYGGETIWDGGETALCLSALIYFDGDKLGLVTLQYRENGKDNTLFLHEDGTHKWINNKAIHTRKLNILNEAYGKTRPRRRTIGKDTTSELTQEFPSLHTTSEEPKEASPQVPRAPTPPKPTTPVTLDLVNPDKSKVYVDDNSGSGIKSKKYSPKDDHHISSVIEGEVQIWKVDDPNTKCKLARVYANDSTELLYLDIDNNGRFDYQYFEKVNRAWSNTHKIDFDRKVKSMKGDNKKDENPPESEEPPKPDLKSKIDSSLFDVEEGEEDVVPVLKLTANDETHELTYGGEVLWEDKKKRCSSAILYLDGCVPSLVLLETKDKKDKVTKVYRYHDGKQWKDGKEKDHNAKLKVLNERYKPTITPTPSPTGPSAPEPPKPTVAFKLDITNPDRTKITIRDVAGNGLPYKEYVANAGYHINHVVDGKVNLWIAPRGQQCIAVKFFIQEADTIIGIFIKEGETKRRKCIEKADGSWKDIDGETFEKKLKAIRGGKSVRLVGNDGSENDDSPFAIRSPDEEEVAPKQGTAQSSGNMVNVHASEVYVAPAKRQKVAPKPEDVKQDIKPPVQSGPLRNCALDLFKPDKDEIAVKESDYQGGIKLKEFSPHEGLKIDHILNNGTPVLQLSEGEEFRSIRLYSKRSSHLLMLTIKKGQVPEHQYYEKIAGDWKLKNQREFNQKLTAMKT